MQRRLTTILMADIVGYTRLMGEDEARTLEALTGLRETVLEPNLKDRSGEILKRMGDGWIVEFSSVSDAVNCAIAIQEAIAGDDLIRLRISVHIGDVTRAGEDIYGDGINVAARLEALAAPGQVLISDLVRYSLDFKAGQLFGGGESYELKNVTRPVCVWHWPADSDAPGHSVHIRPPQQQRGKRPSLAVLPFANVSGDPEQEIFADGITEDIITGLSRFGEIFVIARNTVFTYKGSNARHADVARELGVRYIVEGRVRKAGDRVRVTVDLIEAETGVQAWGEHYDRQLSDILQLQDELTRSIVATLPGRLRIPEEARLRRLPPENMAAYDFLLAGKIHHHRATPEDNAKALEFLDKAIELDPGFEQAYVWKACTIGQAFDYGFAIEGMSFEDEFRKALYTALSLDENDAECHRLLCEVSMFFQELDAAKSHADRAIKLNPNDPRIVAQQGEMLTWMGQPREGLNWLEMADRLDPINENERAHLLGRAYYLCGNYENAVAAFRKRNKPRRGHLAEYAASCALCGMHEEARRLAGLELERWPDFTISDYVEKLPFALDEHRDHLAEGMRKAGIPD